MHGVNDRPPSEHGDRLGQNARNGRRYDGRIRSFARVAEKRKGVPVQNGEGNRSGQQRIVAPVSFGGNGALAANSPFCSSYLLIRRYRFLDVHRVTSTRRPRAKKDSKRIRGQQKHFR